MSRIHLVWKLRIGAAFVLLATLGFSALFPRSAWAACGPLDMGACIDNAEYSFYYLIASIAWNVNRWLLLLAYQFDQLRAWLVSVAFSGAYQWLTSFVEPIYIPIATAALMLAAILFMLVPLTGDLKLVNLRHVLIWAVMTPVVLVIAGQLVGQAEQLRSDVSARLFTQMSQATPGAIFGSPGSDMPAPVAIYPSNPCGTTLARTTTTGIAMDALAAALMYADAGDIHCPDARGPSRDVPDGLYNEPPAFAYDGYVGDLDSAVERRGWVEGMQRGMTRLLQGVIPSFLAVLESFIHLVFSLSMAVLWLSLPIGLIFVWFQQTASPVSSVLRRAASVLITSWMASLVMGVLSAALVAAAQLGNAGAYTGMAFGGLFLMGYLSILSLSTLWKSIGTVEQTALGVTGMSFTQPLQTAAQLTATAATAGAAGVAAGVVGGGATYLGMAAAGSTALAQSQGRPLSERAAYATSAMVGRLPGAGAVGEVAAAMGWLDTEGAIYQGVYAGDRSHHTWRSARIQMERDNAGSSPSRAGGSSRGGSSRGGAGPAGGAGPVAPPPSPGGAGGYGPVGTSAARGAAGTSGGAGPAGAPAPALASAPAPAGAPGPSGASGAAGSPATPSGGGRPSTPGAPGAPSNSGASSNTAAGGSAGSAPAGTSQAAGPQVGGVPVTPLPPTNLHAVHASAQIGSLPNPATGADWTYVGSVQTADGFRHAFQHPAHPLTGRPETRWIESTPADVAAARTAQTGRLS